MLPLFDLAIGARIFITLAFVNPVLVSAILRDPLLVVLKRSVLELSVLPSDRITVA